MSRSSTAAQRQAERDAERIGQQVARAFQHAARAADRGTRNLARGDGSRGGGRMHVVGGRARRAPATASQYHFHAKKSRASGAGKSPMSARAKLEYDLGVDEKDKHKDRVKAVFVSVPEGQPASVKDPLRMADACHMRARQSKYANSNTTQMFHFDTALPNFLTDDQQTRMAEQVNAHISKKFNVPAYSGLHADPDNVHLHSSIPLYEILSDRAGGYRLGNRIDHAKRPSERKALGIAKSPAGELRELRQDIANLIADVVADELKDHPDHEAAHHTAERWRHGHLKLSQQVEKAAARGDVQFVFDNLNRDATRKEGPRPQSGTFSKSDPKREQAEAYNLEAGKPSATPAPELITRTLVNRVVDLAERAGIDTPESFRMLARDMGLLVHWSLSKEGGVQGVTFSVSGGPRVAGQRVGASLGTLQKKLSWQERPEYRRYAPRKGQEWDEYQEKIESAGIRPADSSDKAIKVTLDRLAKLEEQALKVAKAKETPKTAPAAPLVESAPAKGAQKVEPITESKPKKDRPKRQSNDPLYSRKIITQAASRPLPAKGQASLAAPSTKDDNMNTDELLSELRCLPDSPSPAAVTVWAPKGTQEPTAGAEASAARTCHIPNPANLTPRQRDLIASEWDTREAQRTGAFDGPLTRANGRLEQFRADMRKRLQSEPWPAEAERKRFMRRTAMMETDQHREWREALAAVRERADTLEAQIVGIIDNAIRDRRLLAVLSDLEARDKAAVAEQLDQMRSNQERQYAKALTTLEHSRPGSHDRTAAQASIRRLMGVNPDIAERERQRRAEVAAKERQRQGVNHNAPAQRQR